MKLGMPLRSNKFQFCPISGLFLMLRIVKSKLSLKLCHVYMNLYFIYIVCLLISNYFLLIDADCSGSKLPCLSNGTSVNGSGKSKLVSGSKKCDSTNTSTSVASGSGTSSSMKTLSKEKTLTALQKDPKSSNVYKSLFTSSEECKKKPEQHWITYNPLYF